MPLGRPGDGLRDSFHDLTIAHLNHELARTILCCTCNKQLSRWRRGSWKASFRFCARIGTMNHPSPTSGHPLPIGWGEGRGEGAAVHGSWVVARLRQTPPVRLSDTEDCSLIWSANSSAG